MLTEVRVPCRDGFVDYDVAVGEFLNVSEGEQGEDRVSFRCGLCGRRHESALYIRRGSP